MSAFGPQRTWKFERELLPAHAHAVNSAGEFVVRKTFRRAQMHRFFEQLEACLVGIEACGTSLMTA